MSNALEWPEELGSFILEGRYGFLSPDDSSDTDRLPNLRTASRGTVTVTPSIDVTDYTNNDAIITLIAKDVEGVIGRDGRVYTKPAGWTPETHDSIPEEDWHEGIILPATDASSLNPTDFYYRVIVSVEGNNRRHRVHDVVAQGSNGDIVIINSLANPIMPPGIISIVDESTAVRAETAAQMAEGLLAETFIEMEVQAGELYGTTHGGTMIHLGHVQGPPGEPGEPGPPGEDGALVVDDETAQRAEAAADRAESAASSTPTITIGGNPPEDAHPGDIWFDLGGV